MKTSIIRPGYLVSLKTEISGGVSYVRTDKATGKTEAQIVAAAKKAGRPVPVIKTWETIKTIDDPDAWGRACFARSRARSLVSGICCATNFGMLCPVDRIDELETAIAEARKTADDHNAESSGITVSVFVITGQIASTDEESARAIASEVQDLVTEMNGAIDRLDTEAIRKAASKAAKVSAMLSEEKATIVTGAVAAARKAARVITKRVETDGEKAAVVLADIQRGELEKARFAFLDMGMEDEPLPAPSPAGNVQRSAELEIDTDDDDAPASGKKGKGDKASDSPVRLVVG